MSEPWGVSIIIVNYNNERFLASAIDSVLGQDYPLCEVIVVDDCSTDQSRAVIARYGEKVRPVLRRINGRQIAALNTAWPFARYPILIFLDSDDLLLPHAASRVTAAWTVGTVKAQFPLVTIDGGGCPLGHIAPKYPANLTTEIIREALLRTGQSPSSPGSGNAYSRSLLERVREDGGFDLDNSNDYWMDNVLECNAPFYGEIVTIREPLACYRMHDGNLYALSTFDRRHFAMMARTYLTKLDYLAERCRNWGISFDPCAARNQSPFLLECGLVAAKLPMEHGPSPRPVRELLYYGFRAYLHDEAPKTVRIIRALWFVSVAFSPRRLARWLIALRFQVAERPGWLARVHAKLTKATPSAWVDASDTASKLGS